MVHNNKNIWKQPTSPRPVIKCVVVLSPEVPMGEVAGVPLWTLSPKDWEAACGWEGAPEGPGRGPGGISLCGEVRGVLRGVLGCDVCPPASLASRRLRICNKETQTQGNNKWMLNFQSEPILLIKAVDSALS